MIDSTYLTVDLTYRRTFEVTPETSDSPEETYDERVLEAVRVDGQEIPRKGHEAVWDFFQARLDAASLDPPEIDPPEPVLEGE